MQVASGILRGIPLHSPRGSQTRPSTERLRQATFNILRHYRWHDGAIVEGAKVIDLFSGTGAWGIEAISNGAAEVWFVESHALALRTLHENLKVVAANLQTQGFPVPALHVIKKDVGHAYQKLPEARVVFCDPPYEKNWAEKVLDLETRYNRIEQQGLLLFEAGVKESVVSQDPRIRHFDTKIYGDSAVHFFIKQPHHGSQGNLSG
ncbi:MAG: RsmD family RNA methyltransferase [Bdellovibrionota bacterium]